MRNCQAANPDHSAGPHRHGYRLEPTPPQMRVPAASFSESAAAASLNDSRGESSQRRHDPAGLLRRLFRVNGGIQRSFEKERS